MSIFSDNTAVKFIVLEDKIFQSDKNPSCYTDSNYNTSNNEKKFTLDDKFKVSDIGWNYFPDDFSLQRIVEPRTSIFQRFRDYSIKRDSFSVTYRGARKTIHVSDLLKPEAFELFRLCNNIPAGLLRIGLSGLQVMPENIPDDIEGSRDLERKFYRFMADLIVDKVMLSFDDKYKAEFRIERVYTYQNYWKTAFDCSFELISINNEPVYWWGWDRKYSEKQTRFNLRPNPVKIYWTFDLICPNFSDLKKMSV